MTNEVKTDMEGLLARVEAATGPDRYLDMALFDAIDGPLLRFMPFVPDPHSWMVKVGEVYVATVRMPYGTMTSGDRYVPKVTESIDAALALVERKLPGRSVSVTIHDNTKPMAVISATWMAQAKTAPLAILAALLRALIAQEPALISQRENS